MAVDESKRDFLLTALGAFAGIGGGAAAYSMVKTWDPLPSVVAGGVTKVDVSTMKAGELRTVEFRGKPVYILKKTPEMAASNNNANVKIGADQFTVVIAICTHLGCIPAYAAESKQFKCACHGGEFDANGANTFGPPPKPLIVPPYKVEGNALLLGEEGEEYKKLAPELKA
ncbi:MAG TPA: ubiquinol-cytochrome c reductase iron-sulfur subunit [Campylobacterales bacterium]|nr:ubiquinol-cytochrome c reductase iron-sulfur subunit [Campylobacterales bacterium]